MKIVTYNTGHGKFNADYKKGQIIGSMIVKQNLNNQIKLLKEIDADIILTQESGKLNINQYKINQFNQYKKGLIDYYAKYYSSSNFLNLINIGNASFTKVDAKFYKFDTPYRIKGIRKNFRRINKCVLVSKLIIDGKFLCVFNVHLVAYEENKKTREKQIAYIFEKALKEYLSGNHVIIGGDFNHDFSVDDTLFQKYEFLHWIKAIPTKGTIRSNKEKYTNKSKLSTIDGFICSPNIDVKNVESIQNFMYSDHSPVVMNFELK